MCCYVRFRRSSRRCFVDDHIANGGVSIVVESLSISVCCIDEEEVREEEKKKRSRWHV